MGLKGKKPTAAEKRLKLLLFGPAGVGKTTAAIGFPRPYLIDTERGAENDEYVKRLDSAGGLYLHTTDPLEVIEEVKQLIATKHEMRTLVIDPMTVIYNEAIDSEILRIGGADPTAFGRHKAVPDRLIKHMATLLFRLDMNVVITSHSKPLWVRTRDSKGTETVIQEGNTFDCYARLDYMFDLVIEIAKRGKDRVGVVRKTRITSFPEGDIFPFSYGEIATRYGRDILEREAAPVALATAEQIVEIKALLADRVNGQELADKWLSKADADNFTEMKAEDIAKCIAFLGQPSTTATKEA